MAEFQNTIDLLGDDVVAGKIADRTIEEYTDDGLTIIGKCAFAYCENLKSVNLPLATRIYNNAFYYCKKLKNANLPAVTLVDSCAFQGCLDLTSADFPLLTRILSSAFQQCQNLTSVNFPLVKSVSSRGLQACQKLTIIDFPSLTSIESNSLYYCSDLTVLILRSETLCSLANTNAFVLTPFASDGTGGTVYVPAALIESYQTATNWSTLYAAGTCNFVAIEGSEYE